MLDKPTLEEARAWGRRFPDWQLNPFWQRISDSNFRPLVKVRTPVSVIFKYETNHMFAGDELYIIQAEILKTDGVRAGECLVRIKDRDFRVPGKAVYVVRQKQNKLMSSHKLG